MKQFYKVKNYLKEAGLETKLFVEVEHDSLVATVRKDVAVMDKFQPDAMYKIKLFLYFNY